MVISISDWNTVTEWKYNKILLQMVCIVFVYDHNNQG